jgi:hypothetical protein
MHVRTILHNQDPHGMNIPITETYFSSVYARGAVQIAAVYAVVHTEVLAEARVEVDTNTNALADAVAVAITALGDGVGLIIIHLLLMHSSPERQQRTLCTRLSEAIRYVPD